MSGAEALWGRETMSGMRQDHLLGGGGQRLDTEVGYGLPIGARFVGTPRAGVRTSEYGRDYHVGYGMQVLEQGRLNVQLGIDAERRESPSFHLQEQAGGTDERVLGRATLQWWGDRRNAAPRTTNPPRTGRRQAESTAGARSNQHRNALR